MATDKKDERIGIVGGKKATQNVMGKPFRGPALHMRMIGNDQYVVFDNVSPANPGIPKALKDIGVSADIVKEYEKIGEDAGVASPPIAAVIVEATVPPTLGNKSPKADGGNG